MKVFTTIFLLALLDTVNCFSQELYFNHILSSPSNRDGILCIAQDRHGFIWFGRYLQGLQRFDGSELKSFQHDPNDTNSISSNWVEVLVIDENNIFWIGTWGSGLDRFEPSTNKFIHYRHDEKNVNSLANDTVTALFNDKKGNLWVGTLGGLDLLNKETGQFIHYKNDPNDSTSLSFNEVRVIYEDRSGMMWIGCGRPFTNFYQKATDGGLNSFVKGEGKFKRFMHDDADTNSISNNKVRAIFEDSKGNLWVGTRDDGVQILSRQTGQFKHYYFEGLTSERVGRLPSSINSANVGDHIAFISEDHHGNIIIGSHYQGLISYNPQTNSMRHYGYLFDSERRLIAADTATGLTTTYLWRYYVSNDGLMWITTLAGGDVYTINPFQTYLRYYSLTKRKPDVNSFYADKNDQTLWFATNEGLYKKDMRTGVQTVLKHKSSDANTLCNDSITSIRADHEGNLWLGTYNGLCKYNPVQNTFASFYHDNKNPNSLSGNIINYLLFDRKNNLWIGTALSGIDKFNITTGTFTNFRYDDKDRRTISSNYVTGIAEDHESNIWIATNYGMNLLDVRTNKISHFFGNSFVRSVCVDHSGVVWIAIENGVYYFDSSNKVFQPFTSINRSENFSQVINIIEDKKFNLWLSSSDAVTRINPQRDEIKVYNSANGVKTNYFDFADNFVSEKNEVFLGDQDGYYAFSADDITDKTPVPGVIFTSFKISDVEVMPGRNSPLGVTIEDEKKIRLRFNQNDFSIGFVATSYASADDIKYLYKLDNYDDGWRQIGGARRAYFYRMSPGTYVLHVRGVSKRGTWGEKTLTIVISPPWWSTWWAYALFAGFFVTAVWAFIAFRSRNLRRANKLLEGKVIIRTHELQEEKEKVELTLAELRSTQAQLVQSEKMASLGELTAGIAHEIQNPLNFVNNFSEVSRELIDELKSQKSKLKIEEQEEILDDIDANLEKINHHGKRADAIVKGMLQHSRMSSGQKEPTDINKLADEYLRLAYHGLRAKDKSFNAEIKTAFDSSIGKINVVPQDIGRVLLNLINNAFYAVSEKKKHAPNARLPDGQGYEPTVTLTTTKDNGKIEVKVKDNGNGIPESIVDKIFQPFFTTKPTGQGTGLGLSLAYDIVKAHGGEIRAETKEGEGSEFIIAIPA
jgi:signal transduction histidine kinase/ligand-binding sensor domain-containing protein